MIFSRRSIFLWWTLLVFTTACSSGGKRQQMVRPLMAPNAGMDHSRAAPKKKAAPKTQPAAEEPPKVEKRATVNYRPFTEAINNKNRKLIEQYASQILANSPDDPLVLNGLAHYHLEEGRVRFAEMLVQRVIEKDPQNLKAMRNRAMIYLAKGDRGKAMQEFHRIYQVDPSFSGVAYNLASLYWQAGVHSEAEKLLAGLYRPGGDLKVATAYGQVLAENGKHTESLKVLVDVIQRLGLDAIETTETGKAAVAGYLKVIELKPTLVEVERTRLQDMSLMLTSNSAERASALLDVGGVFSGP